MTSATARLLEGAVHNLKGPASRLRLLSQLLSRGGAGLSDDDRTLVKHIEDSAAEVGLVADGLRNYVEICSRPVQRERLDLSLPAADAIANLRSEIESTRAQITQSELPAAQADRFLMTWLFQELLANAIRFRGAGVPQVNISAATGGPGNWFIAVSDNGPGIEPGLAQRAFLPFKKLSSGGGAGLGLTICRKIIELHGGQMWIEPGEKGAEFRFFTGAENACR